MKVSNFPFGNPVRPVVARPNGASWKQAVLGLLGLLLGTALACNLPRGEGSPTPAPPTTEGQQATVAVTSTPTPSTTPPARQETPLPTFTPIAGPTLRPTPTQLPLATTPPSPTVTLGAAGTPGATETPGQAGPLSFTYTIAWILAPGDPRTAIATVTIVASGGGGGYAYFHDDLPVGGPIFTYQWASCRGNPGSLRVDSADGQTARVDYFENPPCPTPTPQSN